MLKRDRESHMEQVLELTARRGQAIVGPIVRIDFFADCIVVSCGTAARYELHLGGQHPSAHGVREIHAVCRRHLASQPPTIEAARQDLAARTLSSAGTIRAPSRPAPSRRPCCPASEAAAARAAGPTSATSGPGATGPPRSRRGRRRRGRR